MQKRRYMPITQAGRNVAEEKQPLCQTAVHCPIDWPPSRIDGGLSVCRSSTNGLAILAFPPIRIDRLRRKPEARGHSVMPDPRAQIDRDAQCLSDPRSLSQATFQTDFRESTRGLVSRRYDPFLHSVPGKPHAADGDLRPSPEREVRARLPDWTACFR